MGQPRPTGPRRPICEPGGSDGDGMRAGALGADGQEDLALAVARDGDGHGREARQVQHQELAGQAVADGLGQVGEPQRADVLRLRPELGDGAEGVVAGMRRDRHRLLRPLQGRLHGRHAEQRLAHVDADRAPRDAAPAAHAAVGAELVDPGAELVGQPLAVAVTDAGPEVAVRDAREVEREAGGPATLRLARRASQVGRLVDVAAEAGRADHRAAGAGEAALGDLVPAVRFELRHEAVLEPVGADAELLGHDRARRHA